MQSVVLGWHVSFPHGFGKHWLCVQPKNTVVMSLEDCIRGRRYTAARLVEDMNIAISILKLTYNQVCKRVTGDVHNLHRRTE